MFKNAPTSPPPARRTAGMRRWAVVAGVTVVLHVLAMMWAADSIGLPAGPELEPQVVSASLHPAMQETRTAPPVAVKPPKAKPPRAQRPVRSTTVAEPSAPVSETASATAEIVPPAPPEQPQPPVAAATPEPVPEPAPIAPPDQAPPASFTVSLPPPVSIKYDVRKIAVDGQNIHGSAKISWRSNGQRYVIDGEAGVLFFTAFKFRSAGEIDSYGIAPELFTEKRGRRAETNTHFNRERNEISFSSSELKYPRKGGEQDRASIVWQLSGIARGESSKIVPGALFDLFVASHRDGEIWQFSVAGSEELDLGLGKIAAWHLVRVPKKGSYDQKLDVWLAPALQWYPVRVLQTDPNGDQFDMQADSLQKPD